jgi:hypothetical protein
MASPFQQQSLIRKVIYLGVIIGLFSGSWLWRRYAIEPQAEKMAALERTQGEVQPYAAALRLSLVGSRGAVTCFLWMTAMDKQKRHEWNELELCVGYLTDLQPHFLTPWLFQSWNLSYNVSVECDRVNDKYYYIARGIQLLAEGERQNRDNPDLRFNIGFYTLHKIGQSDETNFHRSLFQLSNIPPNERDPARFWSMDPQSNRRSINRKEFEDFCKAHPQLARRLQQGIPRDTKLEDKRQFKCATPEAVVQFLADNRRVPSVYLDAPPMADGAWKFAPDKLRPVYDRFPVLPPPVEAPSVANPRPARPPVPAGADADRWGRIPFDSGPDALTTADERLKDYQDANIAARAWYSYAQEPIPPPERGVSGFHKPIVDRIRQRPPKYIAEIIFRHYPARAQSYAAERLQQEGWYDTSGWEIPNWFDGWMDEQGQPKKVVIGTDPGQNSLAAWQQAYNMWKDHGDSNYLLFSVEALEGYARKMQKYLEEFAQHYPPAPGGAPWPIAYPPDVQPYYDAYRTVTSRQTNLSMTNFNHHYQRARVEAEAETVTARKLFHEAEAKRLTADLIQARAIYEQPEAMQAWKNKVLLAPGHKEFRRDDEIQEQTYEVELKYLELVNEQLKSDLTRLQPFIPLLPKTSADVFSDWIVTKGPFDIEDDEGVPLISENVMKQVQTRRKQMLPQKPAAPAVPRNPEKP